MLATLNIILLLIIIFLLSFIVIAKPAIESSTPCLFLKKDIDGISLIFDSFCLVLQKIYISLIFDFSYLSKSNEKTFFFASASFVFIASKLNFSFTRCNNRKCFPGVTPDLIQKKSFRSQNKKFKTTMHSNEIFCNNIEIAKEDNNFEEFRVRFAPSPTGLLHLGGARTAVSNWLLKHKNRNRNAKFILRIEDTDVNRNTSYFENSILEDLKWLGIQWDEGVDIGGPHAPYRQSERLHLYKNAVRELLLKGFAYPCFCSFEDLKMKKEKAIMENIAYRYDGTCRNLTEKHIFKKLFEERVCYTIRFKIPEGIKVALNDLVIKHKIEWDVTKCLGDFIIFKPKNENFANELTPDNKSSKVFSSCSESSFPSLSCSHSKNNYKQEILGRIVLDNMKGVYDLCTSVDDILMNITHVYRAQDHLSNTIKQILIMKSMNAKRIPAYGHLSLLFDKDKTKLSKRHGATSVRSFREEGYLPESILSYLSLLGHKDDLACKKILKKEDLSDLFEPRYLSCAPPVFNISKLKSCNKFYMKNLSRDEQKKYIYFHLVGNNIISFDKCYYDYLFSSEMLKINKTVGELEHSKLQKLKKCQSISDNYMLYANKTYILNISEIEEKENHVEKKKYCMPFYYDILNNKKLNNPFLIEEMLNEHIPLPNDCDNESSKDRFGVLNEQSVLNENSGEFSEKEKLKKNIKKLAIMNSFINMLVDLLNENLFSTFKDFILFLKSIFSFPVAEFSSTSISQTAISSNDLKQIVNLIIESHNDGSAPKDDLMFDLCKWEEWKKSLQNKFKQKNFLLSLRIALTAKTSGCNIVQQMQLCEIAKYLKISNVTSFSERIEILREHFQYNKPQ